MLSTKPASCFLNPSDHVTVSPVIVTKELQYLILPSRYPNLYKGDEISVSCRMSDVFLLPCSN